MNKKKIFFLFYVLIYTNVVVISHDFVFVLSFYDIQLTTLVFYLRFILTIKRWMNPV